jgi:hypothetical protein
MSQENVEIVRRLMEDFQVGVERADPGKVDRRSSLRMSSGISPDTPRSICRVAAVGGTSFLTSSGLT